MLDTYVISLRERQDRRDALRLPFPHTFLLQDRIDPQWGISWVRGDAGCMLAHRQAIALAAERGLAAVLVLEDDAVPVDPAYVPTLDDATHPVTFLGGQKCAVTTIDPARRTARHVLGTHAVLYRGDSYSSLLASIPTFEKLTAGRKQLPVRDAYDLWLSRDGVGFLHRFIQSDSVSDISVSPSTVIGSSEIEDEIDRLHKQTNEPEPCLKN